MTDPATPPPEPPRPVEVVVSSPADRTRHEEILDAAPRVLSEALAPSLRDDRFDDWSPPTDLVAAVAILDERPVAYLGGGIDRGRLQLDALVADRAGDDVLSTLHDALGPAVADSGADAVELWGKPAGPVHEALAAAGGYEPLRALHQMRCVLPVDTPVLATRGFVPGEDEERLLRVNNRAFAAHPDQGNLTVDDLADAAAQPWFAADGIRLYEDPDDPEVLAGFCWTKIHEPLAPGEPRLGEIYAIGVDPDHHGRGLGMPMTAAGLAWLVDQGLTTGMLYVEADNAPAIRTYEKLGFVIHRTDRAWRRSTAGVASP